MKRKIIYIIGFVLVTAIVSAQDYESDFREVQKQFQERLKTTPANLKTYLEQYPYTPYSDEIYLMEGVLHVEKEKYKQATKAFAKVNGKNLSRETQPMLLFYWGYALLKQENYEKALSYLLRVKQKESLYTPHARYYAGYCYYCTKDFQNALAEFLSVQHLAGYQQIVPYYLVQIDYAQGNYEQVYTRANQLLDTFPDNKHNYELHRMLGEMYYQDSAYNDAIQHLEAYHTLTLEQEREPLRSDIYLLGVANYKVGKYQEAIQQLKNIKEQKVSISESTYLHLGHSYLRVGDEEKAKLSYAAAMRLNINSRVREEAMYNYVQITYLQGSALGDNITAFQDFLREYPNTKYTNNVYALMADMYMNSKNYKAAYDALVGIKQPDAKMQETIQFLRYQLGIDAFLQGNMKEAANWMTQVIKNEKKSSHYKTEAYYMRAESRYRMLQYPACIEDIEVFVKQSNAPKSKNYTTALYLKAYALFNQQLLKQAEYVFRQYISQADSTQTLFTDALNRLGDCLFSSRQFDDAVATYERAIRLGNYATDYALFQQGYALGLLHRYPEKIQKMGQLSSRYPRSDYADDALYETARAHLQLDQNEEAIKMYTRILGQYPNSNKAAKAALELSMTYRTLKQYDKAIQAYKNTIQKYAGSEEAYAALEGLEQVYVETNNISDYLAYTKTLNKINMRTSSQEDSLVYVTAELQYIMGNYEEAAAGMTTYITSFCPGGRYCVTALYYAANSFYQLRKYDAAQEQYSALAAIEGNPYMEEACMRSAEIAYDKEEYKTAAYYFQQMLRVASSSNMRITAQLGILRCNQHEGNIEAVIAAATQLLEQDQLTDNIRQEALYYRAKAHLSNQQYGLAVVDLTPLSKEVRTPMGAEAKYQLANAYFQLGSIELAEEEVMSFTQMQTTQQYWLAKSLILLSDINVQRNDIFQAKQYLLALQSNYQQQDDITTIIADKLQEIATLETANQQASTEIEEDTIL
ncbi:MAG: tetratricopeptide repeat protein [Paludibacteraceae bacterium]|nr:tetratricopeptide repeat protein [Paludibacteraceae bacterium]